jgi:hypothetical protein
MTTAISSTAATAPPGADVSNSWLPIRSTSRRIDPAATTDSTSRRDQSVIGRPPRLQLSLDSSRASPSEPFIALQKYGALNDAARR